MEAPDAVASSEASRLRALAAIASAIDVDWSEDRLLCAVVDEVLAVLGDRSTIGLIADGLGGPPGASSHPDAVQAELEPVMGDWEATESVVSGAEPAGVWLNGHGLRQYVRFPVAGNGRTVGALVVTRTGDRPPFGDEDLAFGGALAAILGVVVLSRRLLAHTMSTVEELRVQAEVVNHISDALITCDEDRLVVSWNVAAESIYGYSESEALGCDLFALLASQCYGTDEMTSEFDEVFETIARNGKWHGELHERHATGSPLVVMASISRAAGAAGRPGGLVLVNRDITSQRREEHRATHDALTGLANRRMLNDRLYEAFARACRTGQTLAVLFIDLDGFKPINDRYGHAAGDEVLIQTAQRLVQAVRRTDTVGRLGGDEFLVILEDAGTDESISIVANRIVASVNAPMMIGDISMSVHPSVGVAPAHKPDAEIQRPDRLLAAADQAMYVAKQSGDGPVFANLR